MDTDIEQKRIDTYRNSNDTVRELYGDIRLGQTLGQLINEYKITDTKKFINITGDVILGFYKKNEIPEKLTSHLNFPIETAQQIYARISPHLSEIEGVQNIPEADKNMKEKLELRPQESNRQANPMEGGVGGKSPLTRADVLRSIAPSRTMAKDIASIAGKGAPQTTIETPAPTPPTSTQNGLK